jgi:very-short-patch-repair endonuclease
MDDKERTHQPLADLAGGQHGVASTSQMEALGYSRGAISYAARSGRLHRLHQGVYAVGHTALAWESHCLAVVLACAPGAVASHATAAWLWGLLRSRPEAFHVTAPTRRHTRKRIRLHFAPLVDEDRAVCEDIPVTSVPRTLLDYAASATPPRLARVLERAEERHLLDMGPIEGLLRRVPGHRGVARLRRALDIYRPEPAFTRSGLERRFLELVRRSHLPNPSMNFQEGGYQLDAYWQPERFAVELDVYETHGSRAAFETDREREEELLLQGIETIRVTGPRLRREPRKVLRRVEAHLERRRRQIAAGVA